jgi:outer membrane protein assembly factor BamA
VVFSVKENRPHVRLGLGYEDFSGWYLIPIQLNMDNLTGHGEAFNLSSRIGYRLSGLVLTYRRSDIHNPLTFWEARLRGEGQDRVYFFDKTEVRHPTSRGGADFRIGRGLTRSLGLEAWLSSETVEADSSAEFQEDHPTLDRRRGDPLPYDELPRVIQDGVARRDQVRLGAALTLDARSGSGLQTRGLRARAGAEGISSKSGDFASLEADVRAYAPLAPGILLAGRARVATVTQHAPFHERYYLGGLYSVRGYPSQSLSPPGGNLRVATAAVEVRSAWLGPVTNPRLVGLAFLDLGTGWDDGAPDAGGGAAGIGYGFRLRLPWVGYVGMDVGFPLSSAPVDDAFRMNLSLGWTF